MFASMGAIGTAGHYLVLILLVQLFSVVPVYATTYGFSVGAIINYILNYKYTFKSDKSHSEALIKFMIIAILGALINGALMFIGTETLKYNYLAIQIIATSLVLIFNFTFNKLWTFAQSHIH